MRTFLRLVAALLAIVSCSKNADVEMQTIRIGVGRMPSVTTKTGETMAAVFQETRPSGTISLRLEGNGQVFNVESGQSIDVPVGDYHVTGTYAPAWKKAGGLKYSAEPKYHVDSNITVEKGEGGYFVEGVYDCWALVLDNREIERYDIGDRSVDMAGGYTFYVAYVWEWADVTLTVVPLNTDIYDNTDVELDGQQVGNWYAFFADRVLQGSEFWIQLPDWNAGQ